MTDFFQHSKTYDQPSIAAPNRTGATLSKGLLVVFDTASLDGAIQLPAEGVPAASSAGYLPADIPNGEMGEVVIRGIVPATAHGAISSGDLISISTTAGTLGHAQSASSGEEVIAQALFAAADGDPVNIRLFGAISFAP